MTPAPRPTVLCIGALHWDVLAIADTTLARGDDRPGRCQRRPGGVALNIALALARSARVRPVLLSAVGMDDEGRELLAQLTRCGVDVRQVQQGRGWRTGRYLAIEDCQGLVAAVADLGALDAAGPAILAPLASFSDAPKLVLVDSNPAPSVLAALPACTDLRVAAASPARVAGLRDWLCTRPLTLYLNLAEAQALLADPAGLREAPIAARALVAAGIARAVVTDGPRPVADAVRDGPTISLQPPALSPRAVTGAGDAFVAAHLLAEVTLGLDRPAALAHAIAAAASHLQNALTTHSP